MTADLSIRFTSCPAFSEDEKIQAVSGVLRYGNVNYWAGEHGKLFEQEYAAFTNTKYAITVSNGTVALELALHGLGLIPGDEVVVPSRTLLPPPVA